MLVDAFQRRIDYLRLSVTDLCNLRCGYCMPLEGVVRKDWENILTFEEIARMVSILAGIGIRRVRLTGGEPLVRKDLPRLVRMLTQVQGIEEVLLTTNGVLLKPLARKLKEAGLLQINIHLDTLSPEKFRRITRWGTLEDVLEGIREARRVGFSPIKLNAVMQRGINDEEVEGLLLFAADHGLILRLIELMPLGPARRMSSAFVSLRKIRSRLEERYSLVPTDVRFGSGPARYYQIKELGTIVGLISPLSQPFCNDCNRIRIGSDGRFQDCLAYEGRFSFRELLRDPGVTDEEIAARVVSLIGGKREGHNGFGKEERNPCMYAIGG